jgi:hypothetical protein
MTEQTKARPERGAPPSPPPHDTNASSSFLSIVRHIAQIRAAFMAVPFGITAFLISLCLGFVRVDSSFPKGARRAERRTRPDVRVKWRRADKMRRQAVHDRLRQPFDLLTFIVYRAAATMLAADHLAVRYLVGTNPTDPAQLATLRQHAADVVAATRPVFDMPPSAVTALSVSSVSNVDMPAERRPSFPFPTVVPRHHGWLYTSV